VGVSPTESIAVIGLGYVGLPAALAFAERFPTVGFDISEARVRDLQRGLDVTGAVSAERLRQSPLALTADPARLAACTCFVVAVPTPLDAGDEPDLGPLVAASRLVAGCLKPGDLVCFESTVYPGATEEVCAPLLAAGSGLTPGRDFSLGYSPERINPGDRAHTFEQVVKVVSGDSAESRARLARLYGAVVTAGVHEAVSIRVAETAKLIENTQRDLNIALMNELALICDRLGIRAADVLEAARTKWNFQHFSPGLVGGDCVGVAPLQLASKARALGYVPEVILAGRRLNARMAGHVAQRCVSLLDVAPRAARVGVLGVTFKEDVPDIRNARVPDLVAELHALGVAPRLHDPLADPGEVARTYGLTLAPLDALSDLDALVWAVPHAFYHARRAELLGRVRAGGVVIDVRSALTPAELPVGVRYWSL
jgi:UDP-N-acetyl-D-galactosamine dehydrogenase